MYSRRCKARTARGQLRHGAAAVEFAIVAPLFLLLLAGIIEFGQAFRIEHMLSNSSRRAARAAIVDGATQADVEGKATKYCVETLGADEADIVVTIAVNGVAGANLSQATTGDEVSVTVSVPYARAGVGFYANTFANSILASTCTLEHE